MDKLKSFIENTTHEIDYNISIRNKIRCILLNTRLSNLHKSFRINGEKITHNSHL